MSDDIDSKLRAALRFSGTEISQDTLRRPTLSSKQPSNSRSWTVAVCAAVAVAIVPVVVLTISNGDSNTLSSTAQASYAGYQWQVESINHAGTTVTVTPALVASATFFPDGRMVLSDTVNVHSGRFEASEGGFFIRNIASTTALYGGDDPVLRTVISAMRALASTDRATASTTADRLIVDAGEFRVVFTREGVASDDSLTTPSS